MWTPVLPLPVPVAQRPRAQSPMNVESLNLNYYILLVRSPHIATAVDGRTQSSASSATSQTRRSTLISVSRVQPQAASAVRSGKRYPYPAHDLSTQCTVPLRDVESNVPYRVGIGYIYICTWLYKCLHEGYISYVHTITAESIV